MMQELTQQIKKFVADSLHDVHTVIPGRILGFDADKCEASIQPFGNYKCPNGKFMEFPQLSGVPVYAMQGSKQSATIAFPIAEGDECLVLFSEQTLETWRTKQASNTDLRFDLSNAMAIVGMFSTPSAVVAEATKKGAIIIDCKGTRITLLPNGSVEVTGNVTIDGNLNVTGTIIGN